MPNLNAVNVGHNKYCGPAVLSILTGKSTDECARVISSINGKYNIEGVQLKDLLEAASRLGFDADPVAAGTSLFGTLVRLSTRDGIYIVTVPKHFVAIEVDKGQVYFCDNHTKEPMPAASSARLQQAVLAVHKVTKRREPILLTSKKIPVLSKRENGEIVLRVNEHFTYDIEKYNRAVSAVVLPFKDKTEYDEFIKDLEKMNEIALGE